MLWLVWWYLASAHAVSLTSPESLLTLPSEERTRQFRAAGRPLYARLAQIAFDRKEPLTSRWRAVTTMGRLDPNYFRAPLDRALISPEWFLRNAALIALLESGRAFGGPERARAVAASLKAISDPALVVRTQAVRGLIALDAAEAEEALWRELNAPRSFGPGHESLWVRAHIAEALAKFARPGRGRAFKRLLLDTDERVHKWAIRGLEASTGLRLGARGEAVEVARRKWLARLGSEEI